MPDRERALQEAADAVARARGLMITAGAGMGVDSGLPDFRGTEGFWRAYPPFARLGLRFEQLATPRHFADDPALAWGFYGHRATLYRRTEPHAGFAILRRWAERIAIDGGRGGEPGGHGAFVFTSNVDGHFQRAGFAERSVVECHGSLLHLQCSVPCHDRIWEAGELAIEIDPESFRALPPLPVCPDCGAVARPNVLMFGDWDWAHDRTARQERRMQAWLDRLDRLGGVGGALTVIEIGAGTAVPTVRLTSELLARRPGATLVRINPREPECPTGGIAIAAGALETLEEIDARLDARLGSGAALARSERDETAHG